MEKFEGSAGVAFGQHAGKLIPNALVRYLHDFRCMLLNRREGGGLYGKLQTRSKADCAKHAEFVFAETKVRIADGADQVLSQVAASSDEVENVSGLRILEHAVNGEVAAKDVFARIGGEADCVRPAAIQVDPVLAEGCDLRRDVSAFGAC